MRGVSKNSDPPPIGVRVDIVRDRQKITRTNLAKALGLDRSTVAKWATGVAAPRDLEAVARVLGVPVGDIYQARARQPRSSRRAAA